MAENINDYLAKIQTAVYGRDVRSAIYNSIRQCYIDAIGAGNTNAEVVDARGTYKTLGERLNDIKLVSDLNLVEITDNIVSINLSNKKSYECKNDITDLTISVENSNIDINFQSRLSFSTLDNIEDIKVTRTNVLFIGDNCINGDLILKKDSLYFIEFTYLKSNLLIGQVFSYLEGDMGNDTDPGEEDSVVEELHDFYGSNEIIDTIAMSYFRVRSKYTTYGNTNIMTNLGSKTWSQVTTTGADSPDERYRKLDCSAFVALCMRGITFEEVFQNETTYNNKDLSARVNTYDWAVELPRTAAEQCEWCEKQGWTVTDGTYQKGDLIFFRGTVDNGRYKQVNHVCLYYGTNSEGKECVIEFTSSSGVKKHTDGATCGIQIIQFAKKDASRIVTVARPQSGSPKE